MTTIEDIYEQDEEHGYRQPRVIDSAESIYEDFAYVQQS